MLLFLVQAFETSAQNSGVGIFFQAVAKDNYSNPAKDRKIFIQSSILQSTSTGIAVLTEIHQSTTDAAGVFSIGIGQGSRTGGTATGLSTIPWANGPFYLNLKIALAPTAPIENWDYTKEWIDLGTTPFGTVPYALYAVSAGGLDGKLNISDTSKMLALYAKAQTVKSLSSEVAAKISITDTAAMLEPYKKAVTELVASNITSLTADAINSALDSKVNIADSITKYVTPTQLAAKTFDSTAIYNQLALKANKTYVDTAILNSTIVDADANTKGKLQLAGDFSGTADLPRVANNAITSAKINNGAVTTSKIADLAITDAKIEGISGTKITGTTLASNVLTSSLTSVGTITSGVWSGTAIANNKLANSTLTIGATNIALGATSNSLTGLSTVTATNFTGNLTGNVVGNASTATKLSAPVTINGVNFDGSGNITISSAAANALTINNSGTGDVSGTTFDGSVAKTISYNTIGASPLAGSSDLTTVGTITSGVWSGTTIDVTKGGTGLTSFDEGKLLFGNGTGSLGTSSNLFWDNTTGSLGIGTNTPGSGMNTTLDVQGNVSFRNTNAYRALIIDGDPGSNYSRIYTGTNTGTSDDLVIGTYPNGHMNQLFLKQSNGFIGIRKNNPATALDVNGIVTASGFTGNLTGNATTATTAGNITATSNSTLTSLPSLSEVGTITSGVWSGTTIAIANGGTGSTTKNFVDLSTDQTIAGYKAFDYKIKAPTIALSNGTLTGVGASNWEFGTAVGSSSLTLHQGGCCGRLTIDDNGRFAIGANYAPTTYQFDVQGNGRFTQDLTAPNFIGNLSGNATTATTAGNITATSNSTLTSLPSLAGLGTITSGTWNGSTLGIAYGGTGATTASAALTNLGAEATVNKSTDIDMGGAGSSDTKYPSQLAVKTYVSNQFASGGVADNSITNAKLYGAITSNKLVGTDITTVGTITSGTWNASTISVPYGGTGATTLTGYVKGNGAAAMTASASIPVGDVTNAESILNRATATDLGAGLAADTKYPSQLAVKTYVDTKVAAATIADADASTKGKIQLTGDLGGNAGSPSVIKVGGSTAANINTAEQLANAATDANTNSTLVKRNSSGNFSAGTITANLVGDVTGNVSGNAANVTGIVTGANGGTGINNGSKTITIGGDFATVGTGALSLNYSGTTNLTLPATGTVATLSGSEEFNNKKINGLSFNNLSTGFSINGGTISTTLTLTDNATLSGTNTGDQTITLSGDLTGSGTGVLAATLTNTGVAASTYGSATTVPTITVDAKGRITSATNTTITGVSPIGASLTSANLYIGDVGGVAKAFPITGDFTISSGGVGTISASSITDAMLAGGINLATKVSGILPVTNGGLGANNLTGYIYGNGSSAFTSSTTIPVANIAGAVAKVNGVSPVNGEVTINYGTVTTGKLTDIPTPTNNGDMYVVSNDDQSSLNNGRTFITTGTASTTYSWTEVVSNQSTTDARYVRQSGGTMSANSNLLFPSTSSLSLNYTPTSSNDAVNKSYVDDLVTSATPSASSSVTGKIQLTGDLGGTATSPTVIKVGGSTASDINDATLLTKAAVYSNTANAIVKRDGSGNFEAGTITANLVGNVTGNVAGNATNVTGVVAVANGGSGASTLTGYVKGNGTNAFTSSAAIPVADVTNAESNQNKSSATDLGGASTSDTYYPTQKAVKTYVDTKVAAATIPDATVSEKGKIQLAGDLGNTAASPSVLKVGGSTASSINSATVAANAATASNTASAIVKRDASGNFSANMITANLTGDVTGNLTGNASNVSGIVLGANGGTGVANTGKTITLGGNLVTSGAYSTTFVATSNTNITLPTTGTLATLSGSEALTNKTINSLTPTALTTGFTIAGGSATSKTLTVSNDATVSGTNTGDQTITLTGDLTGSGTGSFATTLANSGVASGTYGSSTAIPSITIDSKGRITSATTTSIIAGVNTIGAIAASSNANGATVSGTTLTLTPADGTNGGIVTNGSQIFAGTKTFSATISGTINGNAGSATKLQTARTIGITGDITYTSPSFDGTANITGTGTLTNTGVTAGTYGSSTAIPTLTIDAKGRVTSAGTTSIIAGVNTVNAIAGTSNVNGATISGTTITLTPADATNGGIVTNGSQTFSGAKTFSNTTSSTSTTTGSLVVGGGVGIAGSIYAGSLQGTPVGSTTASTGAFTTLSSSGLTTVTNTTSSTSTTTGALVISGGVGIAGNQNIGGTLGVIGAATLSSTVNIPTGSGDGKVLRSDATGNATWAYAAGLTSTKTSAYTITLADQYVFFGSTASAAATFTLPLAAGNAGKEIIIKNKSAYTLTVQRAGSTETIFQDNANNAATSIVLGIEASNNWVKLVSDGTQWVVFRALF